MSSPAPIATYPTDIRHQTSNVNVSRMALVDISAVMEIERLAFPRPWPEKAYRYELNENPNAYFVVARLPDSTRTPHTSVLQKLMGLIRPLSTLHAPLFSSSSSAVVGFAGMWMYVDEAHIATLATHPGWRGRGIGETILQTLLREAQRRNATMATLEVRAGNVAAQSLYRKYGFEEVGRRKQYYQDNHEDALIMTVTNFNTAAYRDKLDALVALL